MQAFLSAVEGNGTWLDGGAMFGNAPRPMWEKWLPPDSVGRIPLASRGMLLEFDGVRVLCETGIGVFFEPKLADRYGVMNYPRHVLLESLQNLGLKDSDIDFVILSHLHFDHAGGLLPSYEKMAAGQSELLFPNAKYLVGREAWERAQNPHFRDRASFIPDLNSKLKASGRLVLIEPGSTPNGLPNGFEFRLSHGHTPGQVHTVYHGPKTTVVFAGDLIPGTAWVHIPITMGYDRYPELLIDEKTALYEDVVRKHWMVFYTHDPKVAASRVDSAKGKFQPIEMLEKPVRFAI